MLVLRRDELAQIIIDVPPSDKPQQVVVSVCRAWGGGARIGVTAPPVVRVLRAELHPEFADHPLLRPLRKAEGEDLEPAKQQSESERAA